jgi:hypothetical protein
MVPKRAAEDVSTGTDITRSINMKQKDLEVKKFTREKMLMHEANRLAQRLAEIHSELQAMHHLED